MASSSDKNSFDASVGHKYFSADYFNRVWGLLDKKDRTPEEDALMLSMCHASFAHWNDRDDVTDRELSIGLWQLSRVYAVLGKSIPAKDQAERCVEVSANLEDPFCIGYSYEALARAEKLARNEDAATAALTKARECAEKVESEEDKKYLLSDLEDLG